MRNYNSDNSLGPATIALAVVNIAVYVLGVLSPGLGFTLYRKGVLSPERILADREVYRIVTSVFLHADTNHLFSNTVALLYMGDPVEKRLGSLKYLIIYFVSGIGGNLLTLFYETRTGQGWNSLGASGAVFGLIGALLVLCIVYRNRMGSITPARMLAMAAYSVYSGFMMENTNNIAHIGGLIAGLLSGAVLSLPGAGRQTSQ